MSARKSVLPKEYTIESKLTGKHWSGLYLVVYSNELHPLKAVQQGVSIKVFQDHRPFGTLSTIFPDDANLPELSANQFYAKTWSEAEGLLDSLIEQGAPLRILNKFYLDNGPYTLTVPLVEVATPIEWGKEKDE